MKTIIFFSLFILFFATPKVEFITLYINSEEFVVEIADTDEKRLSGMMNRKQMPDNFGMLFIFEEEGIRGFWMKNVLIPLDIIYLNKNKQVVNMYLNVPPCVSDPCESYLSKYPAKYVLELKGNRAKELKLKKGDYVFFTLE